MPASDSLAIVLDRAAHELDAAAEIAAEPLCDLAREARALAQALRCCPRPRGLPELAEDLRGRLEAFGGVEAARVGARVSAAVRALRGAEP